MPTIWRCHEASMPEASRVKRAKFSTARTGAGHLQRGYAQVSDESALGDRPGHRHNPTASSYQAGEANSARARPQESSAGDPGGQ